MKTILKHLKKDFGLLLFLLISSIGFAQPVINQPTPIRVCDSSNGNNTDNIGKFYFTTTINSQVLGNLSPSLHTITYFATLVDAQNNTNSIASPYNTASTTVYLRVIENSNPTLYSTTSLTLTVVATPSTPVITNIVQPTCNTSLGSITLSGLPSGNWSLYSNIIFPGSVSSLPIIYGNTSSITVDYAPGEYNFTVRAQNSCYSDFTSNITINSVVPTPIVGTITQPTCSTPTGSVVLSGLPTGTWTIISSPNSVSITGNTSSAVISNLQSGNYSFAVINSNGCLSAHTSSIAINLIAATPYLTIESPVCEGTTYTVNCKTNGTLTASLGTVTATGNIISYITNIPVGQSVTLTSTNSCGLSTSMVVNSPNSCLESDDCANLSYSVGNGVCEGNSYGVAYRATNGTIATVNSGLVGTNKITGVDNNTDLVITFTNGTCTESVTVKKPTNCNPTYYASCESNLLSLTYPYYNGSKFIINYYNPKPTTVSVTTESNQTVTPNTIESPHIDYSVYTTQTGCATINLGSMYVILSALKLSMISAPTCASPLGVYQIRNYVSNNYIIYPDTVLRNGAKITGAAGTYTITTGNGFENQLSSFTIGSEVFPTLPNIVVVDTPYDGIATFDLTQQGALINGTTTNYTINYYKSIIDAQNQTNAISNSNAYVNTTNPETIYMGISTSGIICAEIKPFKIVVTDPNVVYIPDTAFKNTLLSNTAINTNGDNEIQKSEALMPTSLELVYNSINDLTGINSFTNLTTLNCGYNNLTTLDVSKLSNLNILSCHTNNLKSLFIKNGKVENQINLNSNPNLTYICADEAQLASIQAMFPSTGTGTGQQVVIVSYCTDTPGGQFNTITGKIRFDANNNGCDFNDVAVLNLKVKIDDGTTTGATVSTTNGEYKFFTQAGTFALTPSIENPAIFNFAPVVDTVTFINNNNNTITKDFCLSANGIHNDLEVVFAPNSVARPGFPAYYKVVYKNKGNQTLSGNVNVGFNDALMDYSASSITPTVGTGQLSWAFANLLPFESRAIYVTFIINTPTVTPPVNAGTILNYTATITPNTNDDTPADNQFVFNHTVVNSYDPNDITCLEGASLPTAQIGNYLHYVINFENTGDYPAEDVNVKIEVDPTKFDINSLQQLESSHPVFTNIKGNVVTFQFKKIKLNPKGHGNVLMKMRSKSSLTNGASVAKRADIYFDYNYPVDTGNAVTVFENLSNSDINKDASIVCYPNPTKTNIKIKADQNIKTIELFDIQGRLLETSILDSNNINIDMTNKSTGTYFLKIKTEKGIKVEKIVKE